MAKKEKKALKLPKKKMDEMLGFEEVIDGFITEQEKKKSDQNNKDFEKGHDNYSIYDFLELEKARLGSLESFFRVKLPNMKAHNQLDCIMEKQQEKLFLLREDVVKRIKTKNSSFMTQMKGLFDQSFK